MMLAKIVVLLVGIYAAVVSAKNLRHPGNDIASADIIAHLPVDNMKGKKAFDHIVRVTSTKTKSNHKAPDAKFAKLSPTDKARVTTSKVTEDIEKKISGAYITRYRPNGDCSGLVTLLSVRPLGCSSDGEGTSTFTYCERYNDELNDLYRSHYDNSNCVGTPSYTGIFSAANRCWVSIEFGYGEPTIPEMKATQCIGKDDFRALVPEGGAIKIDHYSNDDHTCDGEVEYYDLYNTGRCELVWEYSENDDIEGIIGFYYTKIESCNAEENTFELVGFSDSSCLRPTFRATMEIDSSGCGYSSDYGNAYVQCVMPQT